MNVNISSTAKTLVTAALIVFLHGLLSAGPAWQTDWQKALEDSAANKRPILMDFYTDWCPHCTRLDKTTFADKTMNDYFKKENYILVKINPEKDRPAEAKFKVYSYPTLVIFNNTGAEIDRLLGYQSTGQLIKALEDLKKGIGTLEDLLGRLKKVEKQNTPGTFELMFRILDKYTARADYPDGLELIARIVAKDKDNTLKQASAALYQKGYIYYKWKKYQKALDALLAIHKIYPDSEEAVSGFAAAAYYSGKLNDPVLTLKILKDFVKRYPDSRYAERSRKRIAQLEKK
jgi:thioredoxin-related protein